MKNTKITLAEKQAVARNKFTEPILKALEVFELYQVDTSTYMAYCEEVNLSVTIKITASPNTKDSIEEKAETYKNILATRELNKAKMLAKKEAKLRAELAKYSNTVTEENA